MESTGKNNIIGVDLPPVMSDEDANEFLTRLIDFGVLDDIPDEQFINNSESQPNAVSFVYLCP